MPFGLFIRHKVAAHKVRQITTISYSPVIQIKFYMLRQRNDRRIQQFQFSKNTQSRATRIAKVLYVYCEPGSSSKAERTNGSN